MNALFDGSTEQLRPFIPGMVLNFSVSPSLQAALNDLAGTLLPRFLGNELSALLIGADQTSDPKLQSAQTLALAIIAKLGFADYLPFAEVQIGDDGITVTAVENRRAAFDYQTKKLDQSLREGGWQKLDELLGFMAANPDLFPGWEQTPYQLDLGDSLFRTAAEFSKYYPIQNRWLTFWAMRPSLDAVEDGQGQIYRSRIDALPNSVTDNQKAPLLRMLKRCLAYEAVILALPSVSVELNGPNVQLNYGAQYGGSASYYTPPTKEQIDWVRGNLRTGADVFWTGLDAGLAALMPVQSAEDDDQATGLLFDDGSIIMF